MSRSTLLKIFKTKAVWDVELRNGFGSGPAIWDFIYKNHTPKSEQSEYGYWWKDEIEKIWPLWKDPSVPFHRRVGLFFTYDRCLFLKEHIAQAAVELRKLAPEMEGFCGTERVNHWPEIADYFERLSKEKLDRRLLGIAINCTSVSDVWDGYPKRFMEKNPIECTSADLFDEVAA